MVKVIFWGDPKLESLCEKVEDSEFGPQLQSFGEELITLMHDPKAPGVGLAAPQVGVLKRLFVMEFPDHKERKAIIVCNPTLVLTGNTVYEREGCLSLPNIHESVSRAANVTMQYFDPLGNPAELVLESMDARVAQHEFDHLNGIMFFDYKDKRPVYGARMSRQMSRGVLSKWEKEKQKRKL